MNPDGGLPRCAPKGFDLGPFAGGILAVGLCVLAREFGGENVDVTTLRSNLCSCDTRKCQDYDCGGQKAMPQRLSLVRHAYDCSWGCTMPAAPARRPRTWLDVAGGAPPYFPYSYFSGCSGFSACRISMS